MNIMEGKKEKRTFISSLRDLVKADPGCDMLITYGTDMKRRCLTRKRLFTLASRFANVLKTLNVQRGDIVINTLPTSLEAAVVVFGTILAGGVTLTVDVVTQKGEELFHCIKKSECKVVVARTDNSDHAWSLLKPFVQDKKGDVCTTNAAPIPSLERVIIADRENVVEKGLGFLERLDASIDSFVDDDITESDPVMILLTSGTTGFPKLSVNTHGTLIADAKNGAVAMQLGPCKYYIATSWSWAVSLPVDFLWGFTRVSPDLWHHLENAVKHHAKVLKKENIRSGFLSPAMVDNLIKEWDPNDGYIFDQVIVGGTPVNHVLCERLMKGTKLLTIRYASTENIHISYNHIRSISDFQDFDCGKLFPGCEVRIVGDNYQELPPGAPGRLLVKTDSMFKEYLNDPEKTAKAIVKDGWYNSNDAGYFKSYDGHLVVIGRYDYIILHNTTHVFPAWIEDPIRQHPEVLEVVVVPIPDDANYHNVCACVKRRPGSQLTAQDIRDLIQNKFTPDNKELLAPHHVLFYDNFPSNARGKIVYNKLIADATSKIKHSNAISGVSRVG